MPAIEDIKGAAITVITAGAAQKPGETRLDLPIEIRIFLNKLFLKL